MISESFAEGKGQNMKKTIKSVFMGIVLLILAWPLAGCRDTAPWDHADVTWYAEDPADLSRSTESDWKFI